jgi:hypothetical protein
VLLTGAAFPVRTLKVVWVPFTEAMALFGYGTSPLYWGSRLFRKRGYVSRLGNQLSWLKYLGSEASYFDWSISWFSWIPPEGCRDNALIYARAVSFQCRSTLYNVSCLNRH